MILAQSHQRRRPPFPSTFIDPQTQHWPIHHHQTTTLYNQSPTLNRSASDIFSLGPEISLCQNSLRVDVDPSFGSSDRAQSLSHSQDLMQPEHSNNSWLSNGQLTPTSSTRAHHRESSLSSLGSPATVGDIYYDIHDHTQYHTTSKPLTPAHTPSQENFLSPQYSNYNLHNFQSDSNRLAAVMMGIPTKQIAGGDSDLMPAPEFSNSGRPSVSVASHDSHSPATPPSYDEERQKTEYRSTMPKLDRTMTDIYSDELYSPNFQITSAPQQRSLQSTMLSPNQNDIFSQRLQAANNQHLSLSASTPLSMPSRERSPFRQGSPLAPATNSFGTQPSPNMRLGTASQMREQQKAENDARMKQQFQIPPPEQTTPKTISPKDVDLVYHENEEDSSMPLFPPQPRSPHPRQHNTIVKEDIDDNTSQQSYGSMVTSRRESSSAYSASSQATQHASSFNFAPPAVPGSVRQVPQIPQQYPFISNTRRQPNNMSNVAEEFPSSLTSMESSSSEYATESSDLQKPEGATADGGTYTCTYHGCTLRFETPAKLQKHKREGHRQSASLIGGGDGGSGMTSAAQLRNSQSGPHKCGRTNPSTGKPCNTIFSRPYDLTRHEDTIHNSAKQKVRCHLCTEEKTFSRNDALTRHFRVCHPDVDFPGKNRRRGGAHD